MKKPTLCGSNRVNVPDSGCDDCTQLLERLEALEECCEEVQEWKDGINSWKDLIDAWKTTINEWKDSIESWKSTVESWMNSTNIWKNTINQWKNVIDTWKENLDQNGYDALTHKPTINGVTVQGDKTSEDYLITPISTADIETLTPMDCYIPPCADSRVCYGETCCMIVGCDEAI